jgi:methyl-accepting chemotaxis protein
MIPHAAGAAHRPEGVMSARPGGERMAAMTRLPLPFLLLLAVALAALAAGCGGKSSDTTPASEWADDLCSAITTWTGSLQSAADSLKGGNLSKDSVSSAADDVKSATDDFVDDVKGLGTPDTESGEQAKEAIDTLSDQLNDDAQKIESTIDDASGANGLLNAISVVSSTLVTMGNQVSSTFSDLKQLDPKGELEDAFKQADSCQSLANS